VRKTGSGGKLNLMLNGNVFDTMELYGLMSSGGGDGRGMERQLAQTLPVFYTCHFRAALA
jgi:hypothetical protein